MSDHCHERTTPIPTVSGGIASGESTLGAIGIGTKSTRKRKTTTFSESNTTSKASSPSAEIEMSIQVEPSTTTTRTSTTCTSTADAASSTSEPVLRSPSLSSPSCDVLFSEEESVADLDFASEGECSSMDMMEVVRRRQDKELDQEFCSGGVAVPVPVVPSTGTESTTAFQEAAVAVVASMSMSMPVSIHKCAPFSEPVDDSEASLSIAGHSNPLVDDRKASTTTTTKSSDTFVVPPHLQQDAAALSDNRMATTATTIDHSPKTLPKFRTPRTCMWTSSHAANCPSEDRSSSLVNVLLQPLPPNYFDSETQLPPLETDYTSLVRLSLWSVIDGHGGGCVATYASEVLLPHIAASVSRSLGCAIVDRGVCVVNGQLRDANALDLDGLIKTSDRSPANPNSIHYRSPYEASDSEEGDDDDDAQDDEANDSRASTPGTGGASIASSLLPKSQRRASVAASVSSAKTSVKTAASLAARDAPVGTHSPNEVAAITRAITESFLAVDEGWINSIDPVATHQTSCQSNGRWNSGACALVVFTVQRLEWTNVSGADRERELREPEKCRGHDTSQNKDAARRRMLDYVARTKSASSMSTISSTSSLTTTEDRDRINASGLEFTETEGEDDDDHSTDDGKPKRRDPCRGATRANSVPKESLISAPGGCSCHCYHAYDALLYTAHVGDCRAVMLGSAPPRTIKVLGSSAGQTDATDDESSHHSSDETECLSSSDHDADSSDDEDVEIIEPPSAASTTTSSWMTYMRRPDRRQSRRLATLDDLGTNAPFIALPPLEGFKSVEIEIDSDEDLKEPRNRSSSGKGGPPDDSSSSQESHDTPIHLPPVTRPIDLTTDHSAYNPAEVTAVLRRCNNAPRAITAGVGGGIKRVAGSLAVTRALGDAYLKTPFLSFFPYKRHAPYITARPEVNCRPVVKDGDKVLILATDGVWERASGEDALRWVRIYYAERIAEEERQKNRDRQQLLGQSDRVSNDGSVGGKQDDDSVDRNEPEFAGRKRENPRSSSPSSPPSKRRKLDRNRGITPLGSHRGSTVADVIVRRVLNKVRRARNISSLRALMSLPPGRARRSKHDDITACVVDLSAFVS